MTACNVAIHAHFSSPIGFPRAFHIPTSAAADHEVAGDTAKFYCQYRSKRCWNLRALKQNGVMHKLCEFHRDRANANQRRLEHRRRARRGAQPMDGRFVYPHEVENDIKLLQEILPPPPTEVPFVCEKAASEPSAIGLSRLACMVDTATALPDQRCITIAFDELKAVPPFDMDFYHLSKSDEQLLDLHDPMIWSVEL